MLEVLRHRDSGLALEAAVRRATHRVPAVTVDLRRAPAPAPRADPPAAVEDQPRSRSATPSRTSAVRARSSRCCSAASSATAFLRESYARWVELARTARVAVVFADLDTPRDATPRCADRGGAPPRGAAQPRVDRRVRRARPAGLHGGRRATRPGGRPRLPPPLRGGVDGGPPRGALRQPGGGGARRRVPAGMAHRRARRLPATSRRAPLPTCGGRPTCSTG